MVAAHGATVHPGGQADAEWRMANAEGGYRSSQWWEYPPERRRGVNKLGVSDLVAVGAGTVAAVVVVIFAMCSWCAAVSGDRLPRG